MKVLDLTVQQIMVSFSLSDREIDLISLALSKATIVTETKEEEEAVVTLTEFSQLLNTMLDKVEQANNG